MYLSMTVTVDAFPKCHCPQSRTPRMVLEVTRHSLRLSCFFLFLCHAIGSAEALSQKGSTPCLLHHFASCLCRRCCHSYLATPHVRSLLPMHRFVRSHVNTLCPYPCPRFCRRWTQVALTLGASS